jgi:hypothetical protein
MSLVDAFRYDGNRVVVVNSTRTDAGYFSAGITEYASATSIVSFLLGR